MLSLDGPETGGIKMRFRRLIALNSDDELKMFCPQGKKCRVLYMRFWAHQMKFVLGVVLGSSNEVQKVDCIDL
jgi:hypothetical protein